MLTEVPMELATTSHSIQTQNKQQDTRNIYGENELQKTGLQAVVPRGRADISHDPFLLWKLPVTVSVYVARPTNSLKADWSSIDTTGN